MSSPQAAGPDALRKLRLLEARLNAPVPGPSTPSPQKRYESATPPPTSSPEHIIVQRPVQTPVPSSGAGALRKSPAGPQGDAPRDRLRDQTGTEEAAEPEDDVMCFSSDAESIDSNGNAMVVEASPGAPRAPMNVGSNRVGNRDRTYAPTAGEAAEGGKGTKSVASVASARAVLKAGGKGPRARTLGSSAPAKRVVKKKRRRDAGGVGTGGISPGPGKTKKMEDYLQKAESGRIVASGKVRAKGHDGNVMQSRSPAPEGGQGVQRELAFQSPPPASASRSADAYAHMRSLIDSLRAENEDLRAQLDDAEVLRARASRMQAQLRYALTEAAVARRREAKRESDAASERLGRIVTERNGTAFAQVWDDGVAVRENRDKLRAIQADRERLERKRRDLGKVKKAMLPPADAGAPYEKTPEYTAEVDEILKLRAAALKREESVLADEKAKMAMERECLVRELGRQADEASSMFGNFPVLQERYLLLDMLGRGGFSEVFKAYDFEAGRMVALKVHQLAPSWSEARKVSFLRHMNREIEIHSALLHPRILRAHGSFTVNGETVVSVMDLCTGSDLDRILRKQSCLPEREARSIIAQLVAALAYLNDRGIVHYDLKPGNILVDNGQIRITDFGLSKVVTEKDADDGLFDLTSQGAGTMWYLPPECFERTAPRISSKVDVWSAGVILYQVIFGTKPFGNGQTQEAFFTKNTAAVEQLVFPSRPAASDVCKDFIGKCLTRNVHDRPDIKAISAHPFLQIK